MATGLTIIQNGSFTSSGNTKFLSFPMGLDWLWVYNQTVQYAAGAGTGAEFYWDTTMTPGRGTVYTKTAATNALAVTQLPAGLGFTYVNQTGNPFGISNALTSISNATPPQVLVGSTAALTNGMVVRIYNTVGGLQLGGVDFTITVTDGTHFALAYMRAIVAAGGPGTYRIVNWQSPFYPRNRTITKISNAVQAIITLSVTHSLTVGQKVRLVIPKQTALAYGMTQLNGMEATIVATGQADVDGVTNTITINVDTTGFGVFAWPLTADFPVDYAQVVPMGENSAVALNPPIPVQAQIPVDYFGNQLPGTQAGYLADATTDVAQQGIYLAGGAGNPGGANADFVTWMAGVSFSVNPNS